MDLASLFGMQMGQQRQAAPSPPLMRFKAGKLAATQIAGTTQYDVKAEHKRGEILLVKSPQNDLRFQWKDRSTGNVDDDIKVFPKGSAEFTRVDTGREEDRVYLLSIKNTETRLFVWMQEKSDEKDAEIVEKIGKYLDGTTPLSTTPAQPLLRGNLGASAATAATASTTGTAGTLQLDALDAFFANSNAPAAATTPASATTTPTPATTTTTDAAPAPAADPAAAGGSITNDDLMRAMMAYMGGAQQQREPIVPLSRIVDMTEVEKLVENDSFANELIPLLPEGQQDAANLRETLRSPQLLQSLDVLTQALQTGNYNSVMANFGLNPEAGGDHLAQGNGVRAFIEALEAEARANNATESSDVEPKQEGDKKND